MKSETRPEEEVELLQGYHVRRLYRNHAKPFMLLALIISQIFRDGLIVGLSEVGEIRWMS